MRIFGLGGPDPAHGFKSRRARPQGTKGRLAARVDQFSGDGLQIVGPHELVTGEFDPSTVGPGFSIGVTHLLLQIGASDPETQARDVHLGPGGALARGPLSAEFKSLSDAQRALGFVQSGKRAGAGKILDGEVKLRVRPETGLPGSTEGDGNVGFSGRQSGRRGRGARQRIGQGDGFGKG